jgi:hypothetical protein
MEIATTPKFSQLEYANVSKTKPIAFRYEYAKILRSLNCLIDENELTSNEPIPEYESIITKTSFKYKN